MLQCNFFLKKKKLGKSIDRARNSQVNHEESVRWHAISPVDISAGFEGGTKVIGTMFGAISKRILVPRVTAGSTACAKSHVIPTRDFGIITIIHDEASSPVARLA